MSGAVERLTDPRGGSIQIYCFKESPELVRFREKCFLGYETAKSLQLVLLDLGEEVMEEVLLVETEEITELHIHGGEANAKSFEAFVRELGFDLLPDKGGLNGLLQDVRGDRSISYLLSQIQGDLINEEDWEIEGYEFLSPLKVVIVGPPNAGKSTFFNWMVGANQALVSDQEGTTRDLLSARIAIGGCEVELMDTAGLDPSALSGEQVGGEDILSQSFKLSLKAMRESDLILAFDWAEAQDVLVDKELIAVGPKAELKFGVEAGNGVHSISVHTGLGLEELTAKIESWVAEKRPVKISPNFSPAL